MSGGVLGVPDVSGLLGVAEGFSEFLGTNDAEEMRTKIPRVLGRRSDGGIRGVPGVLGFLWDSGGSGAHVRGNWL